MNGFGMGDNGRIESRATSATNPITKTDKPRLRARRRRKNSSVENHREQARGQQNAEAAAMRVRPISITSNERLFVNECPEEGSMSQIQAVLLVGTAISVQRIFDTRFRRMHSALFPPVWSVRVLRNTSNLSEDSPSKYVSASRAVF